MLLVAASKITLLKLDKRCQYESIINFPQILRYSIKDYLSIQREKLNLTRAPSVSFHPLTSLHYLLVLTKKATKKATKLPYYGLGIWNKRGKHLFSALVYGWQGGPFEVRVSVNRNA